MKRLILSVLLPALAGGLPPVRCAASPAADTALAKARAYVEKSDRYLHHSKLKRGMKGYGLTVLKGQKVERFQAEVVSVMTNFNPHQDVVLVELDGLNLEETGIISGMSGSPVYFQDPDDGKFKMVGAVAYGWSFQTRPVGGVQPITQMLAVGNVMDDPSGVKPPETPKKQTRAAVDAKSVLAAALDPKRLDFAALGVPRRLRRRRAPDAESGVAQLLPLRTPLMVSGMRRELVRRLREDLTPLGLSPVQSGGAGGADVGNRRKPGFEPGGGIAVPLVTGDIEWAAVGTVTDVIGERVLAFGHSFFADGETALPMGPAYIHTVISSQLSSFKLGSATRLTGQMTRDEYTGISGIVGRKVAMIPLEVTVEWVPLKRTERYTYRIARHRWFTATLMRYMLEGSAYAWRGMPEHHTVRHEMKVDFGDLGVYAAGDLASNDGAYAAMSDLARPLYALANNPFGPRRLPESASLKLTITEGARHASLLDLRLDGEVYRPGETLTGALTVRPFREDRRDLPVRFELPADLEEGRYTLTAADRSSTLGAVQEMMPHRFSPRTTKQLWTALQRVTEYKSDLLYLRLPLPRSGGVSLGAKELPRLPASTRALLKQADLPDTFEFTRAKIETRDTGYLLRGTAEASFTVRRTIDQTRIRKQGNDQ